MTQYNFNIRKLEDKVLIDVNNWKQPSGTMEIHRLSGRSHVTFITEVLYTGSKEVSKDDVVLLSSTACSIATSPTSPYEIGDGKKYFNIPISQVMGIFENADISFKSLKLQKGKVLFKKVQRNQNSNLVVQDKSATVGGIVKVSEESQFSVGDLIAVQDNVSTQVYLDGIEYYCIEENMIVAILTESLSLNEGKFINKYILMKPYISNKVLNSTLLETPNINYEDLDYSDINNRDLFIVYFVDNSLSNIKREDILLLNRDYTNYFYYDNEKYFILDGEKWVSGKIIERKE